MYIHVCIYTLVHINICMYIRDRILKYVHMCIYMYVCIYRYIYVADNRWKRACA